MADTYRTSAPRAGVDRPWAGWWMPVSTQRGLVGVRQYLVDLGQRLVVRSLQPSRRGDRGDVPGWVLVTLMTAGLVLVLWGVARERLSAVFTHAIDSVLNGP